MLAWRAGVGLHNRRSDEGEGGRGGVEPFQDLKYKKVALLNVKIKVSENVLYFTGHNHEWMSKKIITCSKCEGWQVFKLHWRHHFLNLPRKEAWSSPVQSCSRVRASSLLTQPTHSLDTIAETSNAMRMSNSVFKETTSTEKETHTAPQQQRKYALEKSTSVSKCK